MKFPESREDLTHAAVCVAIGAIFVALYTTGVVVYRERLDETIKSENFYSSRNEGIEAVVAIKSLDVTTKTGGFVLSFIDFQTNKYIDGRQIIRPFLIYSPIKSFIFLQGETISEASVAVTVAGNANEYPLDSYQAELAFAAFEIVIDSANPSATQLLPISLNFTILGLGNSLPNFDVSCTSTLSEPSADVEFRDIRITYSRPPSFKVYPFFVLSGMLIVIVVEYCAICVLVVFKKRRVEAPFMGVFAALIFALPTFRNSQPAAPPIGSLLDWCGFFYAEAGAVLTFAALGYRYLRTWDPPPPPPPQPLRPPPTTIINTTSLADGPLQKVIV